MKKLLALLLVVVMAGSLFAGCGSKETASSEPAAQAETQGAASGGELGLVGFSSVRKYLRHGRNRPEGYFRRQG